MTARHRHSLRGLRLAWHRWWWCGPEREPDGLDDEWTCNVCDASFYVVPTGPWGGWEWLMRKPPTARVQKTDTEEARPPERINP